MTNSIEELYENYLALDGLDTPSPRANYDHIRSSSAIYNELNACLTEPEQLLFERFLREEVEYTYLQEKQSFVTGFRLGAKLMLDVLRA